jgi:hypothetical protein
MEINMIDKKKVDKYSEVIRNNMDIWIEELKEGWLEGKWRDCSLDEYCAYKTWLITQGEEFFITLQKEIEEKEGIKYEMDIVKHDSWIMYLESLGISSRSFLDELYEKMNDEFMSNQNKITEGGIA